MALNRLGLLPQIKPQFFYTEEVKERKEDALPQPTLLFFL